MTRKQRSEYMKAIWVRRRAAKAAVRLGKPIAAIEWPPSQKTDETERLGQIVELMNSLSSAGRQYLVNRFM